MRNVDFHIPRLRPPYARADLEFVKGQGAWLTEADGSHFLDLASGIAVNSLGHAHPDLVNIIKSQAEKLWHVSNLYKIPQQRALADVLVANSFADTVFFTNSGKNSDFRFFRVVCFFFLLKTIFLFK